MQGRRALLVGIDVYDHMPRLDGCVADVRAMHALLEKNEDGSPNYDCRLLTSSETRQVTKTVLRQHWSHLFDSFTGDILFYFSGHGTPMEGDGYLITQEGTAGDPGLPMSELLSMANRYAGGDVLLIVDCCYAGSLGNPVGGPGANGQAYLREGVTILTASGPSEVSLEIGEHGVFTRLVLHALEGGAADVRGNVSAAAIYAYVEQTLGPWEQRPIYKSHAKSLAPVRRCVPGVPDAVLRELPAIFAQPESALQLDPSFEWSHPSRDPAHVVIFDKLKQYRDARLIRTVDGRDLYFAALESTAVQLTPQGRWYWYLAKQGRI